MSSWKLYYMYHDLIIIKNLFVFVQNDYVLTCRVRIEVHFGVCI